MTSRLVLGLNQAANSQGDLTSRSGAGLSIPIFASNSILGNIGAPLQVEDDNKAVDEPLETNVAESITKLDQQIKESSVKTEIDTSLA